MRSPFFLMRWMLLLVLIGGIQIGSGPQVAGAQGAVDAKIEIVWPHDEQGRQAPVDDASLVNVEVYLFERGTREPVACDYPNRVVLRSAHNTHQFRPFFSETGFIGGLTPTHHSPRASAVQPGVEGERVLRTVDGRTFPVWLFNDVAVKPWRAWGSARPGFTTTYFVVEVDGVDYRTNVWAHGADPRTIVPTLPVPRQVSDRMPSTVDAQFAIVWPHDTTGAARPVQEAPLANIAVDLAVHEEDDQEPAVWKSVSTAFRGPVRLLQALNDDYLIPVAVAPEPVITRWADDTDASRIWPRWHFNDVDVAAARDARNSYYFAVAVDGVSTHTTIWAHGSSPLTYFPARDVPSRGCA